VEGRSRGESAIRADKDVVEGYVAYIVVAAFIAAVFAWELGKVWWRETQWRRERNRRGDDR